MPSDQVIYDTLTEEGYEVVDPLEPTNEIPDDPTPPNEDVRNDEVTEDPPSENDDDTEEPKP